MLVADDRILGKLKETQRVIMQRQLKQRCLLERNGRIGLPTVSDLREKYNNLGLLTRKCSLFLIVNGQASRVRGQRKNNRKVFKCQGA